MLIELQLELIDLQTSRWLKEKYREGQLVKFYRCQRDDKFSKLKKLVSRMVPIFGTTYT